MSGLGCHFACEELELLSSDGCVCVCVFVCVCVCTVHVCSRHTSQLTVE